MLWACDEIRLDYTQEDWGAGFRPTSDPAFQALSPKGLVPVVVDGDAVLTESNTIVRYLAARYGRPDLLPADPVARAQVDAAMDWQATEFNTAWRTAFLVLMRNRPDAGTPEQVEASITEWTRMVALLDGQFADGRAFICGATFTVADIVIGLSLHRWFRAPIPPPGLSRTPPPITLGWRSAPPGGPTWPPPTTDPDPSPSHESPAVPGRRLTTRRFAGNPAAVMLLEAYPEDETLRAIAAENNLSETAFLVREGGDYHLRWFTPRWKCRSAAMPRLPARRW